jgi:hypothetical protein
VIATGSAVWIYGAAVKGPGSSARSCPRPVSSSARSRLCDSQSQFYLGLDLEAQTRYGIAPGDHERILEILLQASQKFSQHRLAKVADVSLSEVSAVLLRKRRPTATTLARLYRPVFQTGKGSLRKSRTRPGGARGGWKALSAVRYTGVRQASKNRRSKPGSRLEQSAQT